MNKVRTACPQTRKLDCDCYDCFLRLRKKLVRKIADRFSESPLFRRDVQYRTSFTLNGHRIQLVGLDCNRPITDLDILSENFDINIL